MYSPDGKHPDELDSDGEQSVYPTNSTTDNGHGIDSTVKEDETMILARSHEINQGDSPLAEVTGRLSAKSSFSVDTAIFVGNDKDSVSIAVETSGRASAGHIFSPVRNDDSPSNCLDIGTAHQLAEDNPQSFSSINCRSPLAHFPIHPQSNCRLTASALTKHVIGDAGGQLHHEDTRQARLVESLSTDFPQGLSADVWNTDDESFISNLRPEPLRINRQRSQPGKDDIRRWSRLFDGLSEDVPEQLKNFEMGDYFERSLMTGSMRERQQPLTGREKACEKLKGQMRNFADAGTPVRTPSLHRSSSAMFTPTNDRESSLHRKASFALEDVGRSGFTPERVRAMPKNVIEKTTTQRLVLSDLMNPQHVRTSKHLSELAGQPKERPRHGGRGIPSPPKMKQLPNIPKQRGANLADWEAKGIRDRSMRERAHREDEREVMESLRPVRVREGRQNDTERSKPQQNPEREVREQAQLEKELKEEPQSERVARDYSHSTLRKGRQKKRAVPADDPWSRIMSPTTFEDPLKDEVPARTKTPSPDRSREITNVRTPSSTISGLFRRRIKSEAVPAAPRTPASPALQWRPFDETPVEPPCRSLWLSGQGEDKREKEERAAYFKAKAEKERVRNERFLKRDDRKPSFTREELWLQSLDVHHNQSKESLVGWRSFIDDAPEPLFSSSPLPPVPPLPSASHLNLLDMAHASQRAASLMEIAQASARARSPEPQPRRPQVEQTQKLHQPSRETLRSSRTPSTSALRSAFQIGGRRMSFGRTILEKGKGRDRDDEVVARHK